MRSDTSSLEPLLGPLLGPLSGQLSGQLFRQLSPPCPSWFFGLWLRPCFGLVAVASLLTVAGLVSGCGSSTPSHDLPTPTNLLLVTFDTTRADRLGCYGYDRPTSPHLDALAQEGVLFEQAISTSSITPTSHASIMTGLNPYHHGVRVIFAGSGYRLDPVFPTLATVFRDQGFATAAFLSSFTVSEFFGFDQGFDVWNNGLKTAVDGVLEWKSTREGKPRAVWATDAHQRRSDDTVDEATKWLSQATGPFFSWVHLWDPHDPDILPPDEWLERFPAREGEDLKQGSYDAEIAYMDQALGRLLDALRAKGVYDDTAIVVIADHGEGLGQHGWPRHRLLFQEQIRVPWVARFPGGPSGERVSALVRNTDVTPTLLDLFGLEVPVVEDVPSPDGRSVLGLLRGADEKPRIAYAEALNGWDRNAHIVAERPHDLFLYCAMDRDWKLIYNDGEPQRSLLYNVEQDPNELENLYDAKHEQVVRLKGLLDDRFGGYRRQPFKAGADAEAEERLRSLGYIGGR